MLRVNQTVKIRKCPQTDHMYWGDQCVIEFIHPADSIAKVMFISGYGNHRHGSELISVHVQFLEPIGNGQQELFT